MTGWSRWLQLAAIGLGLAIVGLLGAGLLLTPVKGDVLILVSARQAERLPASTVALHSSSGWTTLGSFGSRDVPAAPQTANLLQASVSVGAYDSVRLGGATLPVQVQVDRKVLAPILVAIADGRPLKQGVYGGSESVSLGLNQLSGQMKAMPRFNLFDQFGRPFSNTSIGGHSVILAAFHTTCHETCPLYTGLFLQLRKQLPSSVLLVEATTDPSTDSPNVLREYAGRVGAAWTFLTGDPSALAEFWRPFDVELSKEDLHRSTLALIDAHGYIRSYYLGAPDVGGSLPPALQQLLSSEGKQVMTSHGNGWGQAQVLDSLQAMGGLASPASSGEGPAGDFTLATPDGRRVSLREFRGQPVLINFWATYCVPCRVELPTIERVANQHPKLGVLLIDERDDPGAARRFVAELNIRSTVLLDMDGETGDRYGVSGLPTTVFVRTDGSVEGRYVGQTDEQILLRHVNALGA